MLHSERATGSPRPVLLFDNAAPRGSAVPENCFESCQFRHAPQPPYSHEIGPCGFFLFSNLETKLNGEQFNAMEELQRRVDELLGQVVADTMRRVFERWIQRLNQGTATDVDYV
jgi:hypothetical protein